MSRPLSDIRDAHVRARTRAKQLMQVYYPGEPQYEIHKVDPALWTILYHATLREIKQKEGIPEYDFTAEAAKRRGPDGRFFSPTAGSNETRSI